MKVFSLLLLFFLCYLDNLGTESASVLPRAVEDYYWRDFVGLLPTPAIPGGTDVNGTTTYIGQFTTIAEYNTGTARLHTIPAVITPGSRNAVAAYVGRALGSNESSNLKVLCGTASKYKWYSPKAQFPNNCRLVIGGFEDGIPMYIGRATYNKEVVTGKIFSDTIRHREGLICPYNGGEIYPEVYTVLTHCA